MIGPQRPYQKAAALSPLAGDWISNRRGEVGEVVVVHLDIAWVKWTTDEDACPILWVFHDGTLPHIYSWPAKARAENPASVAFYRSPDKVTPMRRRGDAAQTEGRKP
ncbi:hypothetical protein UFOVP119_63 [uncultured Caudovirales phage]|uniref:Uncharacterized protein n=1 Tax=uncultured Caudovirales phage TaxID=2100421 RepID=A0A6J5LFM7_9CAUD|nr:hypothetical protein UFOVP119_63 [uncultured Caudovirales phage]